MCPRSSLLIFCLFWQLGINQDTSHIAFKSSGYQGGSALKGGSAYDRSATFAKEGCDTEKKRNISRFKPVRMKMMRNKVRKWNKTKTQRAKIKPPRSDLLSTTCRARGWILRCWFDKLSPWESKPLSSNLRLTHEFIRIKKGGRI